jgi:hypothetical protein
MTPRKLAREAIKTAIETAIVMAALLGPMAFCGWLSALI